MLYLCDLILKKHGNGKNMSDVTFEEYMEAAKEGKMDVVLNFLDKNPQDIDKVDEEGYTALMYAALEGHENLVSVLLLGNADVNKSAKDGLTPLLLSCVEGNINIIKKLLLKKANFNAVDKDGNGVLHIAAINGYSEICKFFVDLKVDLNFKNKQGRTPLHLAAEEGHANTSETLIKMGANPKLRAFDKSPLDLAAENGHKNVCRVIINSGVKVNSSSRCEHTALHLAARHGHLEVVKLLVEEFGADINVKNQYNNTPLSLAVHSKHGKVAEYLINAGCNLTKQDVFDKSFTLITSNDEAINNLIKDKLKEKVQRFKRVLESEDDVIFKKSKVILACGAIVDGMDRVFSEVKDINPQETQVSSPKPTMVFSSSSPQHISSVSSYINAGLSPIVLGVNVPDSDKEDCKTSSNQLVARSI